MCRLHPPFTWESGVQTPPSLYLGVRCADSTLPLPGTQVCRLHPPFTWDSGEKIGQSAALIILLIIWRKENQGWIWIQGRSCCSLFCSPLQSGRQGCNSELHLTPDPRAPPSSPQLSPHVGGVFLSPRLVGALL